MNTVSLALDEEQELSLYTLGEAECALWLAWMEELKMGHYAEAQGQIREFRLTQNGAENFAVGRTPEGGLFLGAAESIANWFAQMRWNLALIDVKARAIRLRFALAGEAIDLVIPVLPMVANNLPEVSELEVATLVLVEGTDDTYDRGHTVVVACQYMGGN